MQAALPSCVPDLTTCPVEATISQVLAWLVVDDILFSSCGGLGPIYLYGACRGHACYMLAGGLLVTAAWTWRLAGM